MHDKNELFKISLPDKLATIKFKVAKEPHIKLDSEKCEKCINKPCVSVCPAGNYQISEENRKVILSWESCLECGSCVLVCPYEAIEWQYPTGGFGISYSQG
ncbi:MAG: 4Fe-4S dicluster domain-containing protein [Planctomycetota bacterium]